MYNAVTSFPIESAAVPTKLFLNILKIFQKIKQKFRAQLVEIVYQTAEFFLEKLKYSIY